MKHLYSDRAAKAALNPRRTEAIINRLITDGYQILGAENTEGTEIDYNGGDIIVTTNVGPIAVDYKTSSRAGQIPVSFCVSKVGNPRWSSFDQQWLNVRVDPRLIRPRITDLVMVEDYDRSNLWVFPFAQYRAAAAHLLVNRLDINSSRLVSTLTLVGEYSAQSHPTEFCKHASCFYLDLADIQVLCQQQLDVNDDMYDTILQFSKTHLDAMMERALVRWENDDETRNLALNFMNRVKRKAA